MASKEMAAMLDELMGRNRNANPNDKIQEITWEDPSNCKYFLVDFCPHELFTNTKADLGPCPNVHDDEMRKQFAEAKESSRKLSAEDEFLRFCQKMLNDVGLKIKRSKERLILTQMEQAAAAGVSPAEQEELEEKINVLTDKINVLVDQAEKAGCEGDVDEAQNLLKSDKYGPQKAMEVCEICGAFLVIGDPNVKLDLTTANKIKKWQDDHLMGKMHVGYARLKASVDTLMEERRKRREEMDKEREEQMEERRKKREKSKSEAKEGDGDKKRSRSRDRKRSKERKRSRSKSRDRRRSRSRDRRRRSRSRDRKRRSRSRSRDHRRSRDRRY
ncbi:luc7-like protein 3 [Eurytemora carolleeae]|uniref:luc7-like protein 3 n=1 Tax=Eurytemora carolleeae TaxID=1294199 RepID=UPI000C75FDBF|nr:luc7-like protein 3 [Eurytemora carolleeae]|eukprot:XP_023323751.1 luc7-like protein 3 [Eurytemora affinis]